jgi:hypothetical protein
VSCLAVVAASRGGSSPVTGDVPRLHVTLNAPDEDGISFFTGELEPIELRSVLYAAMLLLAEKPQGWALTISRIPDDVV